MNKIWMIRTSAPSSYGNKYWHSTKDDYVLLSEATRFVDEKIALLIAKHLYETTGVWHHIGFNYIDEDGNES